MLRTLAALPEIADAELIRVGDRRGAHGPVFMRSLRPGHAFFGIDPQREAHTTNL